MAFTAPQRDRIQKMTNADILQRIALGEAIIADGIKESAGASALKNVIAQVDGLKAVLRDRDRKKNKNKPAGIVIGLNALNLFARRGKNV